jgi:hypothetical protein
MLRIRHKRAPHAHHHATKRPSPELPTLCSTVTISAAITSQFTQGLSFGDDVEACAPVKHSL